MSIGISVLFAGLASVVAILVIGHAFDETD